jgi:vacuolar protein sorting-associated protein 1
VDFTDEVAGKTANIVDKPIVVTIYSNSAPDLTLVDLPGITKIAIPG